MIAALLAILGGAVVCNPVIALGLVPPSLEGATRSPRPALAYGGYGGLLIFVTGALAWPLHHLALVPMGITLLEWPLLVLAVWCVNRWLLAPLAAPEDIDAVRPFFSLNCAVLGSGLITAWHAGPGYGLALCFSLGLGGGFFICTMLLAHFRGLLETRLISPRVAGWPLFLFLCAVAWLALQGIEALAQ